MASLKGKVAEVQEQFQQEIIVPPVLRLKLMDTTGVIFFKFNEPLVVPDGVTGFGKELMESIF
jgi:hypothetical protein